METVILMPETRIAVRAYRGFQKKFGPATDAGADEFCAINTGA
jgi:hypothetical protein